MASKRSASSNPSSPSSAGSRSASKAGAAPQAPATPAAWMNEAVGEGVKPEQALALIGMGLVGRMAANGNDLPWLWNEAEDGGAVDAPALRQRLELIALALQTGAPLSTAEITLLLGARPGAADVERGGLRARRISRNVWKLSRTNEDSERSSNGFSDGFRRRF